MIFEERDPVGDPKRTYPVIPLDERKPLGWQFSEMRARQIEQEVVGQRG